MFLTIRMHKERADVENLFHYKRIQKIQKGIINKPKMAKYNTFEEMEVYQKALQFGVKV